FSRRGPARVRLRGSLPRDVGSRKRPMSELRALIRGDASIAAIADYLDALEAERREREVNALGRADQARLFEKAGDAPPARLTDLVPERVPELTPVHHPG